MLTPANITKKQLVSVCGFTEQDAKYLHKYRTKVPVLTETVEGAVDARVLHEQLGVKSKFADWMPRRINEQRLKEGLDFEVFLKSENNSGRPSQEYALTIDAAKSIAMTMNSDLGESVRRYFILCEKILRHLPQYNAPRSASKDNQKQLRHSYYKNDALYYESGLDQDQVLREVNRMVGLLATGSTPSQWKAAGFPSMQNHLEGTDLSRYVQIQDTALRFMKAGRSLKEIIELTEVMFKADMPDLLPVYAERLKEAA